MTGPVPAARRALALVAGLLLVITASMLGLHDLADAHLGEGTAQHGAE